MKTLIKNKDLEFMSAPEIIFCLFLLTPSFQGQAGTFVGNGGSPGDVELAIAKKHLDRTFKEFQEYDKHGPSLCTCAPEAKNRPMCSPLADLTLEQRSLCGRILFEKAGAMRRWVSPEAPLEVRWTREPIEVKENGVLRAVDAVMSRTTTEQGEGGRLTLNADRFLQMKPQERLFLLTHEFFHLEDWDGRPLVDEGPIGVFEGAEGGRKLINALAAAAVMEFYQSRIDTQFRQSLQRSQAYKPMWFDLQYESLQNGQSRPSTFGAGTTNPVQLQFRGYLISGVWGSLGLAAAFRFSNRSSNVLSSVDVRENIQQYGIGLSYKVNPFSDPTTGLGQSHFVSTVRYELGKSALRINDSSTGTEDSTDFGGFRAEMSYYFPFDWGFWLYVGGSYQQFNYSFTKVNLKYDKEQLGFFGGISYGF